MCFYADYSVGQVTYRHLLQQELKLMLPLHVPSASVPAMQLSKLQ